MWFSASIVMYVRFKDGNQDRYPVWENTYLIEAASREEAVSKAEELGVAGEGDAHGSMEWDGRPAEWVYFGMTRLLDYYGMNDRPGDGDEITWAQYIVKSCEDMDRLVSEQPIDVRYEP